MTTTVEPELERAVLRLRRTRAGRTATLAISAVFIAVITIVLWVSSASAVGTKPSVVPVYSDSNTVKPSAYVITTEEGTMFFCAVTDGATVYSCQQLPTQ